MVYTVRLYERQNRCWRLEKSEKQQFYRSIAENRFHSNCDWLSKILEKSSRKDCFFRTSWSSWSLTTMMETNLIFSELKQVFQGVIASRRTSFCFLSSSLLLHLAWKIHEWRLHFDFLSWSLCVSLWTKYPVELLSLSVRNVGESLMLCYWGCCSLDNSSRKIEHQLLWEKSACDCDLGWEKSTTKNKEESKKGDSLEVDDKETHANLHPTLYFPIHLSRQ